MLMSAQRPSPPNSTRERASLFTARWAPTRAAPEQLGMHQPTAEMVGPLPRAQQDKGDRHDPITRVGPRQAENRGAWGWHCASLRGCSRWRRTPAARRAPCSGSPQSIPQTGAVLCRETGVEMDQGEQHHPRVSRIMARSSHIAPGMGSPPSGGPCFSWLPHCREITMPQSPLSEYKTI